MHKMIKANCKRKFGNPIICHLADFTVDGINGRPLTLDTLILMNIYIYTYRFLTCGFVFEW